MTRFSFPVLLADVGGTNARFACLAAPDAAPTPVATVPTRGFGDIAAAARAVIATGGFPEPRALIAGAAGLVTGMRLRMTNAPWQIDAAQAARGLALDQALVVNDFEALGLALPALSGTDVMPIGKIPPSEGTLLVVGPGTGLGVGAMIAVGGAYLPMASEGGHAGMGAETAEEMTVMNTLRDRSGSRISAEMLLAGPGLPHLYRGEAILRRQPDLALTPEEIAGRALAGEPLAVATIRRMLTLLARFSADMALTVLARGGVYLAGGILPKIRPLIDPVAFRAEFERHDDMAEVLRTIPVNLVTVPEPAFIGLAALARAPSRYLLDYPARLWTA